MFAGKKSAQIREILISESTWEEMTCLFAPSLSQEAERLLQLSRQQAYRIIRDAGIEAGTVTQTHPHMLRHACGYELAERGADTRLIQDYLGHRNIRHTVRYTASNAARFAGLWERNNLINEKLKREEV